MKLFGCIFLMAGFRQRVLAASTSSRSYLLLPDDYKSNFAPLAKNGAEETFTLLVNLEVWAITEVSLQKQDIQIDMRVSIEWVDYRLELNPNITINRTWLLLSKDDLNSVWKPTLYFRNCKGCEPVSFSSKNKPDLYINKETKSLFAKQRMLEKYTCDIDLRAYPMDLQTCPIQLYIYDETYDVMRLNHSYPDEPAIILSSLSLSEFKVPPIIKGDCKFEEDGEAYACLELIIHLDHQIKFHLMTSYAPSAFIVMISWISFWFPVDMAPARVALGLTSLLTLATRLDQAQKDLPPVMYVKAIDVWMFACIFLVSSSLCEFAVSHYRWRLQKAAATAPEPAIQMKRPPKPALAVPHHTSTFSSVIQVRQHVVRKQTVAPPPPSPPPPVAAPASKPKEGTPVDRMSRIAFPLLFLIFNIVYWSHYLNYYQT